MTKEGRGVQADYIPLSYPQLAIATSLVLVSGAISLVLQLGLERRLILASVRTVVQLLLIGLVLRWVFAPGRAWYVVGALMMAMTLIAGFAAVWRVERRYRGIWLDSVVSIWASSWIMASVAVLAVVQVQASNTSAIWARFAVTLLGMILGNTLNGISLGLDRLGSELASKRDQVDTLLALGATRWEAARGAVRQAVRTGMIPTLNTMMVVGLVSLPGMMTGQLLSGADPLEAVKYQIVIMFLIAAGTSLGTVGVALLGYRRLFTADHQFLPSRLIAAG
jgi:putative ABC transport system permease protein